MDILFLKLKREQIYYTGLFLDNEIVITDMILTY